MKIVTGQEMSKIDKMTIENMGLPGQILMENAARAVCRAFVGKVCDTTKPAVLVLCGSGNNGGDGFCVARILKGWGFPIVVIHIGKVGALKSDARLNYELARKYGVDIITIDNENDLFHLKKELNKAIWVIDALFGTGLSRDVKGVSAIALDILKKANKKIVAIDIPSGINSNTGEILGSVSPAQMTVTFGLPKWGHLLLPGSPYIGELVVADIGFPNNFIESDEIKASLITADKIKNLIPLKLMNAHKTSRGKLAVVGGSRNLLGAVVMAGKAALRAGVGYVTLYVPYSLEPMVKACAIELVSKSLPDAEGGYFTSEAEFHFFEQLKGTTALAIGPGIGTKAITRKFVMNILEKNKLPVVIDADALNALAREHEIIRNEKVPWILTPHPGEASRLLQIGVDEVLSNPIECMKKLVKKYKAIVVLKGPYTIIMNLDERIYVNPTGNPALAIMGTGDLLTGVISSLLARGMNPFEAAAAGVYIHGLMGDIVADELYKEGVTPIDMIPYIPRAMEMIRQGKVIEKVSIIK